MNGLVKDVTLPIIGDPAAEAAQRLLLRGLRLGVRSGGLIVRLPTGACHRFGEAHGRPAEIEVVDPRLFVDLLLGGEMAAGEAYMDGRWRSPDLPYLLRLLARNQEAVQLDGPLSRLTSAVSYARHLLRHNDRPGARRNIAAHYDLSNDLYRLFLDETMAYSCAVFAWPDMTLVQAQEEKFSRLVRKIDLKEGEHLLEIGSGWGGFARYAARRTGCRVTTITLSQQQHAYVQDLIQQEGLSDRVDIQLIDYRDVRGRYDKIVSIEMFEAVGARYFGDFFAACDRLLRQDGIMAMQTIAIPDQRFSQYIRNVDWMRTYIFPGGCLPSLSAMCQAMTARSALCVQHLEDIGPHYATTLQHWRQRFFAHLAEVRRLGFDERFIRMWDMYLSFSEAAFAERQLFDLQLVLSRPGNHRIPAALSGVVP